MKTKAKKPDMLIGVCDKCNKNLGKFSQTLKCSCGGTAYPFFQSEYGKIMAEIKMIEKKYPNETNEEFIKRLVF